jgi:nucleoside-diphosphate-sugar epimerase
MQAFITGGSGFVGRQLIRDLVARGKRVRALARSEAASATLRQLGAEPVPGDLDDERALTTGMAQCDVVFHAAAKVEVWGRKEDFERVTVLGTRRTLEAARAAGVRRFVHVSTEAVLVGGPALIDADETWPLPAQPLGLYPWSKGLAEEEVRRAARLGLHAVIVRPRAIWGAGDNVFLPRLCKLVDQHKFAWIGGGHALTSTCHVKNVCAGMTAAAESGRSGEAYFLTDGAPISYREYLGGLLAATGRDASQAPTVPLPVARLLARAAEAFWTLLHRPGEPPLTRTAVELIGSQVTVNDTKARRELNYKPVITREQGLSELTVSSSSR